MKVLIVCSGNFKGGEENLSVHRAFIYDQALALRKKNIKVFFFLIKGRGIMGYLKNISTLEQYVFQNNFDIIHAHSGLSGLLTSFSTKKPFVVTYHGSDINNWKIRTLSFFPIIKSSWNIFVNKDLFNKVSFLAKNKSSIIPCGVDLELFKITSKEFAKKELKIFNERKIILFSSNFNNKVKNYPLAKAAINKLDYPVDFLEIKNRKREDIVKLLNAVDLLIMTSFSEGSPQIIKEALACNCPIISLDVGDVKKRIQNVENCIISSEKKLTFNINKLLIRNKRSNGRNYITDFDNTIIADKLIKLYSSIIT
tara:strand:- start:3878 stop:4810 length:933 start_codon:yes stop_codon:yes gene_type:complete